MGEQASEKFEDAFRAGMGTTSANCELCGKYVFASGEQSLGYEPGELEALQKKAEENPSKYQELAMSDGISLGQIGGQQFVIDHGCTGLRKYEDFIWTYRKQIVEYLKARTSERLEDAREDVERMKGI